MPLALALPSFAAAGIVATAGLAAFDAPLGAPTLSVSPAAALIPALSFAAPAFFAVPTPLMAAGAPVLSALPVPAALTPVTPAAAIAALGALGGALRPVATAAHNDVTAEYRALWDGTPGTALRSGDHPELDELKKYKVLLVPGFMTGIYVRMGNHSAWPARRYFGDQLDWLKKMGVEHEVVDVHSLQSVEHNAPIVAAAIAASKKPVLVVTHSMGGRILLHALIQRPELRARVRGWTPMQTPFLGSHIADLPAIVGVSGLLRLFGGTKEAVSSMTGKRSREYYERHREAVAEILRVVPVVAFASWVNTAAPAWLTLANPLLKWAWNAVSRRGGKNDILIPVENAALPGMPVVVVHGIDHASAVVDTPAPVDRVRILKTLLTMVLRRGAPASP